MVEITQRSRASNVEATPGASYWPMVKVNRRASYLSEVSPRIMRAASKTSRSLNAGEVSMERQLSALRARADEDEAKRRGLPLMTDEQAAKLGVSRYVVRREPAKPVRQAARVSLRLG